MDFQALIASLIEKGWTQAQIAGESGCGQANIARLLKERGSEPKYSTGAQIVKLDTYKNRESYLRANR